MRAPYFKNCGTGPKKRPCLSENVGLGEMEDKRKKCMGSIWKIGVSR